MKTTTNSIQIASSLVATIAVVFILYMLQAFLIPLLIAIILSVMVFPMVRFLERKLRFNRVLSALSALFILASLTFFVFYFICFQIKDFLDQSDIYASRLNVLYEEIQLHFKKYNLSGLLSSENKNLKIEALLKDNFSKIGEFVTQSGSILSDLFLIPIYIFFFLLYRKFFVTFIYKVFPKKNNRFINTILKKIYDVQKSYLLGLFTVMFIVGVLNSLGLLFLGIENPFFFGFLAALLLLIPYIGILIGSLLPALVALATKDSSWYAVAVIGVFGFVQFLEGNFITPKITGSKVSVNSFVSIIALVLFSMLWGTAGMVLALPITASLKIIFDHTPHLKPYGFLIGEPLDEHLKSTAMHRLKIWKEIRANKN